MSACLQFFNIMVKCGDEKPMTIRLDKLLYDKTAILKAAYKFIDQVYIHLSQDENYWFVDWNNKPGEMVKPEEFENELIEQELRHQLIEESNELRKILLARAMASTIIEKTENKVELPDASVENAPEVLESWFAHESSSNL